MNPRERIFRSAREENRRAVLGRMNRLDPLHGVFPVQCSVAG